MRELTTLSSIYSSLLKGHTLVLRNKDWHMSGYVDTRVSNREAKRIVEYGFLEQKRLNAAFFEKEWVLPSKKFKTLKEAIKNAEKTKRCQRIKTNKWLLAQR